MADQPIETKGGRRGGKAGQRGRGEGREVAISKALSKLLRHAAKDEGLVLDGEGFGRLDQVMKWPRIKSLNVTFADIKLAVADNAKQRFSMKPNPDLETPNLDSEEPSDWVIRANQGHSIAMDSEALLMPITLEAGNVPDVVVHGTYWAFYQPIVDAGGLKRMGRNHIHFSTGLPEDKGGVVSGMRNDAEVLVYVDIKRSLADGGVKWWISENGVVLTDGDGDGVLSTKYFKKVVGRRDDAGVLWQEGEERAKLSESLSGRKPPMGKGSRGHDVRRGGKRGGQRGGLAGSITEENRTA